MNGLGLVLLGAVIGWVLEWIYDVFLWRRKQGQGGARIGNSDLEVRLASSEAEAKKLRSELEQARKKLEGEDRGREKDGGTLRTTQKELETLRGKLNTALGEVSQLKARADRNNEAVEKLSSAQKELRALQTRMAELEGTASRLREAEAEVLRLNTRLEGPGTTPVQPDPAQVQELAGLRTELERLRQEAAAGTAQKAELFALQARLRDAEAARSQLEVAQRELAELREQSRDRIDPQQHAALRAELEDIQAQRSGGLTAPSPDELARSAQLEAELATLRGRLNDYRTLEARLEGMVEAGEHRAVREELEGMRTSLLEMVPAAQYHRLEAELGELRAANSATPAGFAGFAPQENWVSPERHAELEAQLEALQARQSELVEASRLRDLEREALELRAKLEDSRLAVRAAEGENERREALERELSQSQSRVGELEATLAAGTVREGELEELRERLVRMVPAELHLELQQERDAVHQERDAVQQELGQLRAQLESSGSSADQQGTRLAALEAELVELRPQAAQLLPLQQQLEAMVPASTLEGVRHTLEAAQRDLEHREAQLAQLREQNERLNVADSELSTLQARVSELEALQGRLELAEQESGTLRGQLEGMVAGESLSQAQRELAGLRAELEALHSRERALDQAQADSSQTVLTLQAELERASAEQAALSAELEHQRAEAQRLSALEGELGEVRLHLAQREQEASQIEGLRGQLELREKDLVRIREELDEAGQAHAELGAQEAELMSLRDQLEARVPRSDFERLQAELSATRAEAQDRVPRTELERLQAELGAAQGQVQELEVLRQTLAGMVPASELEALRGELAGLRERSSAAVSAEAHARTQAELEKASGQLRTLAAQIPALKAQAAQAHALQGQLEALRLELSSGAASAARRDDDDLQAQLNASEDERAIMAKRLKEMVDRETVQELEDELEQLRAQANNTSGQTHQLLSYIEKLQAAETEIRILRGRLEGKPEETAVAVDTASMGSALDDMFGGFMDAGDKK